jgi:hypothetical protein
MLLGNGTQQREKPEPLDEVIVPERALDGRDHFRLNPPRGLRRVFGHHEDGDVSQLRVFFHDRQDAIASAPQQVVAQRDDIGSEIAKPAEASQPFGRDRDLVPANPEKLAKRFEKRSVLIGNDDSHLRLLEMNEKTASR